MCTYGNFRLWLLCSYRIHEYIQRLYIPVIELLRIYVRYSGPRTNYQKLLKTSNLQDHVLSPELVIRACQRSICGGCMARLISTLVGPVLFQRQDQSCDQAISFGNRSDNGQRLEAHWPPRAFCGHLCLQ